VDGRVKPGHDDEFHVTLKHRRSHALRHIEFAANSDFRLGAFWVIVA